MWNIAALKNLFHFVGPVSLGSNLTEANEFAEHYFGPKATPANAQSLFWRVPLRNCRDLEIMMKPNRCICSQWKVLPVTDPIVIKVARIALTMENARFAAFTRNSSTNTSPSFKDSICQNLTLKSIDDATSLGPTEFTMTLTVNEGYPSPTKFSVEIAFEKNPSTPVTSHSFYQQTTFAVYNSCRPPGAPQHTCICNPEGTVADK